MIKKLLINAVLTMGLLAATAGAATNDPADVQGKRLEIKGKYLYDDQGHRILLRGVNLGFWGRTTQAKDVNEILQVFPSLNHARLVIPWYNKGWNIRDTSSAGQDRGYMTAEGLQIIDDTVAELSARGIWVNLVVRSSHGAGGSNEVDFFDAGAEADELREQFRAMWKFIAARYKDTDYISMYEILSEPRRNPGITELTDFYKSVMAEISTVDSVTPLKIGPATYYHPEFLEDGYYISDEAYENRMIYTVSFFKPHKYTHNAYNDAYPGPWYWGDASRGLTWGGMRAFLNTPLVFRNKFNVPITLNQIGVKPSADGYIQWSEAIAGIAKNNNLHWTWWNWDGGDFDLQQDEVLQDALQPFMNADFFGSNQVPASLSFDDAEALQSSVFVTTGSLDASVELEAGSGHTVTAQLGGLEVYLREVDADNNVMNDVMITDASAIGEQNATVDISIPLAGLTPTAQLAEGHYYSLFTQFESSDGKVYNTSIDPIIIDSDFDGDGIGDIADTDDDNDGVPDGMDDFPLDPVYGVLGDFDGDNDVDRKDISYFVRAIGDPELVRPEFDLNGDGRVHRSDVSLIRSLCTRARCAE